MDGQGRDYYISYTINQNTNKYTGDINIENTLRTSPNEIYIPKGISKFEKKLICEIKALDWTKEDVKEAANTLLGLTSTEIKNVISTLIAKCSITKNDLIELKYAKDTLFSNINGLEKITVDNNIAFGGLDNLKDWLNEKQKLLSSNKKEEMEKRGIRPPKGILLLGVPGCGKSLAAKAISARWARPLYRLDFSTIQGKYVGQSEQQLKEALETAEHVSPCILWIDEIEKGLSGVNDSNGITQRLIGQFLFWLQESKKDVFVVATANDIQALPTELLRKGRFDELFFIDLPNKKERKEIINLYILRYFGLSVQDSLLEKLVNITDNYSGSDLESVLRNLAYSVIADGNQVTEEDFIKAFNNSISMYKTNGEKIEKIRQWAQDKTTKASKPYQEVIEIQ
jgi:SpoVK/Ycf46/Vps4 family AAA+-type ATPase